MAHNVNDLCESRNTAEEFRKDSADMMIFSENKTVTKTEVKEECYNVDMPIDDIEFGYIKEEHISSPENNIRKENLGPMKSTEQSSNENVEDITVTKTEVREECYDVEMLVDQTEFGNIEPGCIFLPEINFRKENFGPLKSSKQSSNKDVVSGNRQLRKEDFKKKQKLIKKHLHLKCNKDERRNSSKRHILGKQNEQSKKYKCADTNDKPFKCMFKNCECTAGQEESCKCSMCGYTATKEYALQVHILTKHSAESEKYRCSDCNYTTHRRDHLKQHSRTHTTDRPFKCTYKNCECTAEQEESCKCSMCGYTAAQKYTLQRHILRKHSAEPKRYNCGNCSYATHQKYQLEQHMRIHTNEKPFKCMYKNCECIAGQEESCKCSMCGYTAAQKTILKMHILRKHSAEPKRYKCGNCNYATHQKFQLEQHMRIHTNDSPF